MHVLQRVQCTIYREYRARGQERFSELGGEGQWRGHWTQNTGRKSTLYIKVFYPASFLYFEAFVKVQDAFIKVDNSGTCFGPNEMRLKSMAASP